MMCGFFFCISVYSGLKFCHSLLDIAGIPVPAHNFRTPSLLTAINKTLRPLDVYRLLTVCKDGHSVRKQAAALQHILCQSVALLYQIMYFVFLGGKGRGLGL
jgi:hypothetical protein